MRAPIVLAIAFAIMGCTSDPEETRERREFTEAQKAGCPAHPFKTEFQHIMKVGAESAIDVDIKIHDYQGYLVKTLRYRDLTVPSLPPMRLMWDFKDENGREIKSGYYFWAITVLEPEEQRVQCTFYVNPADQDKMR